MAINIREGYEFIVDYYQPGDRIFLFGFSRGAYSARSLPGIIYKCGILRCGHRHRIPQAFNLYKNRNKQDQADPFKQSYCWLQSNNDGIQPAVHLVGVWDTVSALGFPLAPVRSLNPFSKRWYGFHDAYLHHNVAHGYQALSIDDQRKIFHPHLWKERALEGQVMEQVWFSGVHANIGGGYRRSGLSDLALEWMVTKAVAAGLLLWGDQQQRVLRSADATGKIYDSRAGVGKVYLPQLRTIPSGAKIHHSVVERLADSDSHYDPQNLPTNYQRVDNDGPVS
ncbi:MAG TPA: hypothetical protein DCF45_07605 [Gammaproteobacteria bacterium]|nr:hypothetical protein [Gammaproteobacteria bacterium]